MAERAAPLSLAQIARAGDILPSTALQILRELAVARLITFDPGAKVYRLGAGIVDLAQAVTRADDFAERSKPYLQAISNQFDVTATATARIDDHHTACVVSISPPGALSLNVTLGGRVPILAGAVGRCIAAFSGKSDAQLRREFDRIRWQAPITFQRWRAEVEDVRLKGYAEDEGIFALGVTTLAAPVFGPDGDLARAVGVAAISGGVAATKRDEIGAALIDAADAIGASLHR